MRVGQVAVPLANGEPAGCATKRSSPGEITFANGPPRSSRHKGSIVYRIVRSINHPATESRFPFLRIHPLADLAAEYRDPERISSGSRSSSGWTREGDATRRLTMIIRYREGLVFIGTRTGGTRLGTCLGTELETL